MMNYPIIKMTANSELSGNDFVGVSKNNSNSIEITIPYGMVLPDLVENNDMDNMKFLKIYVKSIQKALSSKSVKNTLVDVSAGINNPVAAVKIVYDYISCGPFIEYEIEEKLATNGNIEFKRTIQKVVPSVYQDSFVYEKYIIKKKKKCTDNYISLVQGNVINHFMNHGGDVLFGSKLRVNVQPIKLDKTVATKLKKELSQTFNSRKQNVIRWMLEYLTAINISDQSHGKWQYAMIASSLWETMALSVFGNQLKVNKSKYGKRYYYTSMKSNKVIKKGSPTQHDVIYEDNDNIFIFDAKMYGEENNLLSEEVLGKQFGYYKEAKIKEPAKRIINILLLPSIPEKKDKEGFCEYIIEDPHTLVSDDPDKIIFIYKCSVNGVIMDYYYARKKYKKIISDFDLFISQKDIRNYLDLRKTSY